MATIIQEYHSLCEWRLAGQYWSMCGECTGDGCELSQALHSGLITPDQFRGVDKDHHVYAANVSAFPEIAWFRDDFYQAMVTAEHQGRFEPGIVNADLMDMPDDGAPYIAKLMGFLADVPGEFLFIANFVVATRFYSEWSGDDVLRKLSSFPSFRYALRKGLVPAGRYHKYHGRGPGNLMGSFIFVKT